MRPRSPIPLLTRGLRAGFFLACLGLSATALSDQRTPAPREQIAGLAAEQELRTFLADFSRGWCAGEDLEPFFDLSRCRAEIWRGLRELDPERLPPGLDFPEALGRSLSPELRGCRARADILGVLPGADPHEATAYLRFVDTDGAVGDLRLCLTRSGSNWKIWDLEELAAGIGLVDVETIAALGILRDPLRRRELQLWLGQLQRAFLRNRRSDLPDVLKHRSRVPPLPRRVEAFVQICEAALAHARGEGQQVVEMLDLAEVARDVRPAQAQIRAEAQLSLGAHAEAIAAINQWQSMVGVEVESEYLRGSVREAEGSRTRALAAYRRVLELEEHHLDCAMWEEDSPLLRHLAEFRRRRAPEDPAPGLWLAHAAFIDGRYEECLGGLAEGNPRGVAWEEHDSIYAGDRVRSLLRLDRSDEALRVALAWKFLTKGDFLELVVRGVRGEHDAILEGVELELRYTPEFIWNDPDFGPIFAKAPEYAALREKYPRE